jgi:hypothetical protein
VNVAHFMWSFFIHSCIVYRGLLLCNIVFVTYSSLFLLLFFMMYTSILIRLIWNFLFSRGWHKSLYRLCLGLDFWHMLNYNWVRWFHVAMSR